MNVFDLITQYHPHAPADFHVTEQIIENQLNTNMYAGTPIDIGRVEKLWELIVEENDAQLHLVSDKDAQNWVKFRDETTRSLQSAENVQQKTHILQKVIELINESPRVHQDGIQRDHSLHSYIRKEVDS